MDKKNFVHLHVHSQYSVLDGKATIKELVDKAIADGMPGIALTDHGNMYGVKEFVNYVDKVNSNRAEGEKFKPILGCEMYVARESLHDRKDKSDNGYHLIVLAKNLKGYHNLIKLVSKAFTEGMYYKPRTDRSELAKHSEGLIVCSACLGGEVPQLVLRGELEEAEKRILWFKETFGEDYYLELQRHQTFKENADTEVFAEQTRVNDFLIEMGRKHGIKTVCTNDVHFAFEDDAEAHDRLICINFNKKFQEPRLHYTKQEWLKTPAEMEKIFGDVPEAIDSTLEIFDKVEFYSISHQPIMPTFEIPADFGTEEEYRKKFTDEDLFNEFTRDENGNEVLTPEAAQKKVDALGGVDRLYRLKLEADYLTKLTMEGARKRYGDNLSDEVKERLKFELHIMKTMGFPGYFLIVQDFINYGRDHLDVSVGPGRGSAAGSAAAYCLGITRIDPLKYDLLFERFLNPDRISLPDIDVDFDDDGRARVLDYVTKKYGDEKVAHIITFNTMATKTVLRDLARILDLPVAEGNRLAKLVPDRLPEVNGEEPSVNIRNMLKYSPDFAKEAENPDERVREVVKYSSQLEGSVRSVGTHACGVIICRDDITDWVPVSVVTDPSGSKVNATMYEGSIIEDTGLIKMDFLGLKTLSIIKEAVANIRLSKDIDLDIDAIPLDDEPTFRIFADGKTTGIFQFESEGMKSSLRSLKPNRFEDLIAMNALYRPGPMAYIPSFIARKHGHEAIEYDIPVMEKYLKETYGVTVYQEQVMLLSRLLAGFTRGESDMLRKAMGKKQIAVMEKLKVKFMEGGKSNGHSPEALEKIWKDWEAFAKYAFNKSHATCYSWLAYQTAYLKANYPAEFMAAVLSRNLSNGDKLKKNIEEAQSMGLTVKGPSVNESMQSFSVSKKGEILFGISAIKGLGVATAEAIIAERQANGPYKDIYDLVERLRPGTFNRASLEALALAGALDCFGIPREAYSVDGAIFCDSLVKYSQQLNEGGGSPGQLSLFDDLEPIETAKPPVPPFEPWNRLKILEEEKRLVSLYLSAHPLDPYYMELTYGTNCRCADYDSKVADGAALSFGGIVTDVQIKSGKTGKQFGIVGIEDFSGRMEFRLFGRDMESWFPKFIVGDAVMVKATYRAGKFNSSFIDMNIQEVTPLENVKGKIANELKVFIDRNDDCELLAETLREAAVGSASGEEVRPAKVNIQIRDEERHQAVTIRSRTHLNLDKTLVEKLSDLGYNFQVITV
ncbi:MAG: DNA polymerase III subunit alpha [Muribaculaceae bacterium]|nr:DNA polymerase III subunit alpha [Muribaculaceae bacterium]